MRRSTKIKISVARMPVRKAAVIPPVLSIPPRRGYPAWIDAAERSVAFPAATVTPRVRDGLVLRVVGLKPKTAAGKTSHASGAR